MSDTIAQELLDELWSDLKDRKGFDPGSCDENTQQEWRKRWLGIIEGHVSDARYEGEELGL